MENFIDEHEDSLTEIQREELEPLTNIRLHLKETMTKVGITKAVTDLDPEKLDLEKINPKDPNGLTGMELDLLVGTLDWPLKVMDKRIVLLRDNDDFKALRQELEIAFKCLKASAYVINSGNTKPKPDHLPEPDPEQGNNGPAPRI